jgi:hypothetical protein
MKIYSFFPLARVFRFTSNSFKVTNYFNMEQFSWNIVSKVLLEPWIKEYHYFFQLLFFKMVNSISLTHECGINHFAIQRLM